MRVLGVITARGGSKGIPRKNLTLVLGRPLLAWTVDAALAARRLDRVVLSTDDEEIADAGRRLGVEVPFMRPPELAEDATPMLPVLQDVVRRLAAGVGFFDAVFTLQPTSPLRLASDIDGAIELMESTGADSVVSLVEPLGHPLKMKRISETGRVEPADFAVGTGHTPRQQLPTFFVLEGSVYLTRMETLLGGRILGADTRAWIIPRERSANLDTPFDRWLAEQLLRRRGERAPNDRGF